MSRARRQAGCRRERIRAPLLSELIISQTAAHHRDHNITSTPRASPLLSPFARGACQRAPAAASAAAATKNTQQFHLITLRGLTATRKTRFSHTLRHHGETATGGASSAQQTSGRRCWCCYDCRRRCCLLPRCCFTAAPCCYTRQSGREDLGWMFCPYSGFMLEFDPVRGVATCKQSGYTKKLEGALRPVC